MDCAKWYYDLRLAITIMKHVYQKSKIKAKPIISLKQHTTPIQKN